jgi:FKBP-type peptidyl-prolyl cis-trans isomerase FklB
MPRHSGIGILIGACIAGSMAWAEDQGELDSARYLNGYTAGRALAGYYENEEKEEFIRGLVGGISESRERSISEDDTRSAKLAWFGDIELSKKDQASYAAGYLSGDAYRDPESLYSIYVFVQGLMDSLQNSGSPYIGKEQGNSIVTEYQRSQFYKLKRQVADSIKANERAGKAFLASNALQPGITQTISGLQFKIINEGRGSNPAAEDTVVVSLTGRKIDGEVFYDSQIDGQGKPTSIKVNQTLDGWQEALVDMSAGAEWELFLPADLAYGNAGWQGRVAPGETLIYRLKLIEVITAE